MAIVGVVSQKTLVGGTFRVQSGGTHCRTGPLIKQRFRKECKGHRRPKKQEKRLSSRGNDVCFPQQGLKVVLSLKVIPFDTRRARPIDEALGSPGRSIWMRLVRVSLSLFTTQLLTLLL